MGGAIGLADLLGDHLDDVVVGNELAGVVDRLDPLAEFAAGSNRRTHHVAGGELNEAVGLREPLCLGSLAGAGRAEQDQVHPSLIPPGSSLAHPWLILCARAAALS